MKSMRITQRQAATVTLLVQFIIVAFLFVQEILAPAPDRSVVIGTGIVAIVLGGLLIAYRNGWDYVRYIALSNFAIVIGVFLPEPFVTTVAPFVIVIPAVLALVLAESIWVIISLILTIGVLFVRAGGTGVYANPETLVYIAMVAIGLIASRMMIETEQRIAEANLRPVEQREIEHARAEEQARYQAHLIDQVHDAVVASDAQFNITFWNRGAEELYGWTAAEVIGKSGLEFPRREFIGIDQTEAVRQLIEQGKVQNELVIYRKDGVPLTIDAKTIALYDTEGLVIGYLGVARDMTDRKRADERVADALKYLNTVIDASPIGIITYKASGETVSVNPAIAEIIGGTVEQIQRQNFRELASWKKSGLLAAADQALDTGQEQALEVHVVSTFGKAVWLSCRLVPFEYAGERRLLGLYADITDRKRAEEKLRQSTIELERASQRLVEIQETERRQIAQELHDQVGQNLTGLSLNLSIILSQLSEESASRVTRRLQDSQGLVESTVRQMRDIMAELRPAVLDDYGLLAALRWYAERFSDRTSLPVEVNGNEFMPRLPVATETALFRISQEVLNNIAKHAQATHVTIDVESTGKQVRLHIADNGIGFDVTAAREATTTGGHGLVIVNERARAVGGTLTVLSEPGKGTHVIVQVPFKY